MVSLVLALASGALGQEPRGPGSLLVAVQANRFSLHADGVPLGHVLAGLARAAPVRVLLSDAVAEEPVSLTMTEVDLADGIARLLRGKSYVLIYGAASGLGANGGDGVAEVRVLPAGRSSARDASAAASLRVVAPVEAAVSGRPAGPGIAPHRDRLRPEVPRYQVVEDEDPGRRLAVALRAGGAHGSTPETVPTVIAALVDPEEAVRAAALDQIAQRPDLDVLEALTRTVNEGEALRRRAISLIADRAGADAAGLLQRALDDPHPVVRERARKLLDRLEREPAASATMAGTRSRLR